MFGMLDFRAHKLYLIIFGIPNFLLLLISLFGLPFAYYEIGKSYADSYITQVIFSLIALVIIEIIWTIFVTYLSKFYMFLFGLFVDIIPADGRTEEEAKAVVWNGDKAIHLIKFSKKKPKDWTDEDIDKLSSGLFNFFYAEKRSLRFAKIREYFTKNPKINYNDWTLNEFLKKEKIERDIFEKIVTEPLYRLCAIRYSLAFYLIFLQSI